jgi:hypothetical protein
MDFIKYFYHHKPQISAITKLTRCQTETSFIDEYIKLERTDIYEPYSNHYFFYNYLVVYL